VKKLVALFVGLAFVTGIVGFAAAQATAPAPEKKAEEKKADAKKPEAKKKAAAKKATGTVKAASADSVVVTGKDPKGKDAEWTFAVDPKTSIKKGGKAVTAADLKEGDQVTVAYSDQDGKNVASSVTAKGPAKMVKKEKKEGAPAEKPAAEKK